MNAAQHLYASFPRSPWMVLFCQLYMSKRTCRYTAQVPYPLAPKEGWPDLVLSDQHRVMYALARYLGNPVHIPKGDDWMFPAHAEQWVAAMPPEATEYLRQATFTAPTFWPTTGIETLMDCPGVQRVTPFEFAVLMHDRRMGPLGAVRNTPLTAWACGMPLAWMATFTRQSPQALLEGMEKTAVRLWDEHVGFVTWARNVDVRFIPLSSPDSDLSLEQRLKHRARFEASPRLSAQNSHADWRKHNPEAWEKLKDGKFPQRQGPRPLFEFFAPTGKQGSTPDWPCVLSPNANRG